MKIYKNSKAFLAIILISFTLSSTVISTTVFAAPPENPGKDFGLSHKPVCPGSQQEGEAQCHARIVVGPDGKPSGNTAPVAFGPAELHAAYTSVTTVSGKKILAIVDAYDNPTIANDLTVYSQKYGIPTLPVCTGTIASSAVPCFKKIDQNGGTNYPNYNSSWATEIALDVEVAHAMCQNCSILLVEAASNGFGDLMTAITQAINQGATVVSNSWGASEFSGQTTFDSSLNHPGVAILFSSGDAGYGVQYPAASPYGVAVGGTTLTLKNGAYFSETAWSGAGSGCSAYEPKPTWQSDSCANRMVADVSAVADPATGAAVYISTTSAGRNGKPVTTGAWYRIGGTSLAAPVVAGIYALANDVPAGTQAASLPYTKYSLSSVHDIISGSNGSCGGSYLCTAVAGFDGPTGLGTPKGLGAF